MTSFSGCPIFFEFLRFSGFSKRPGAGAAGEGWRGRASGHWDGDGDDDDEPNRTEPVKPGKPNRTEPVPPETGPENACWLTEA